MSVPTREEFIEKFCKMSYLNRFRVIHGDSPRELLDRAVDMYDEFCNGDPQNLVDLEALTEEIDEHIASQKD